MAYPRSQLVSDCGRDDASGKDDEHRRQWIEGRILKLADSFAVSVYPYAVMSNHCHLVLRSDPRAAWEWTDREIAERWLAIFPGSISNRNDPACAERATLALLGNAERLYFIRQRLGSISWFMRALNEPIARMANREDGCTGRFWVGSAEALLLKAADLGQRWMKGVSGEFALKKLREQPIPW